jgi:hypothetical protein
MDCGEVARNVFTSINRKDLILHRDSQRRHRGFIKIHSVNLCVFSVYLCVTIKTAS